MSIIPRDLYEAMRCNIDWTEESPKLIFTFSPDIHPENIVEISRVIEKTVTKWFNCQSCAMDECEKGYN